MGDRDVERFLEPDHKTALRMLPFALAIGMFVLTVLGVVLLRPT